MNLNPFVFGGSRGLSTGFPLAWYGIPVIPRTDLGGFIVWPKKAHASTDGPTNSEFDAQLLLSKEVSLVFSSFLFCIS